PARWYLHAEDVDAVRFGLTWADEDRVPLFVLGGGSSVVFADAGFEGLVLHLALRGRAIGADGIVQAAAGESWDPLVEAAVERGLARIGCLSALPRLPG